MRLELTAAGIALAAALAFMMRADAGTRWMIEDCKQIRDRCNMSATLDPKSRLTTQQCEGMYEAAVKAGGQWGLPDAQAANHVRSDSVPCYP